MRTAEVIDNQMNRAERKERRTEIARERDGDREKKRGKKKEEEEREYHEEEGGGREEEISLLGKDPQSHCGIVLGTDQPEPPQAREPSDKRSLMA